MRLRGLAGEDRLVVGDHEASIATASSATDRNFPPFTIPESHGAPIHGPKGHRIPKEFHISQRGAPGSSERILK
ncbi:MAG: hypothetical protein ABI972_01375 [Acidobacteriota bacterium]